MSTFNIPLLFLLLYSLGCASVFAKDGAGGYCLQTTGFDLRIGLKYCRVGSSIEIEQSKEAMSAELERTVERGVAAGIKLGLACATAGASVGLIDACQIPLGLFSGDDDEALVDTEDVEPKPPAKSRARRTAEEKEANRAAREEGAR